MLSPHRFNNVYTLTLMESGWARKWMAEGRCSCGSQYRALGDRPDAAMDDVQNQATLHEESKQADESNQKVLDFGQEG